MQKMTSWLLGIAIASGLLLACRTFFPKTVAETGLAAGRLRPCPATPNCVCSEQPGEAAFVEPFQSPPARAWANLRAAILELGGVIVEESSDYLRATFTTKVFRFVDDLELKMDAGRMVIHVRSASRIGSSDLGLNRKRVEELRSRFNRIKAAKPD